MKIFSVVLGRSRIEFSVYLTNGIYYGLINKKIVCKGLDYESVRECIVNGTPMKKVVG